MGVLHWTNLRRNQGKQQHTCAYHFFLISFILITDHWVRRDLALEQQASPVADHAGAQEVERHAKGHTAAGEDTEWVLEDPAISEQVYNSASMPCMSSAALLYKLLPATRCKRNLSWTCTHVRGQANLFST